eukprot:1825686-Amphidinium_carterae.1
MDKNQQSAKERVMPKRTNPIQKNMKATTSDSASSNYSEGIHNIGKRGDYSNSNCAANSKQKKKKKKKKKNNSNNNNNSNDNDSDNAKNDDI